MAAMTHTPAQPVAQLVDASAVESINVLGPTVRFLTSPDEGENAPLLIHGTIPPGGIVPLHSHADPETFLAISGHVEGLAMISPDDFTWVPVGPGDVFHVTGGAKHAWRNRSPEPAVSIIVTTARIGRFFREVGTPADPASGTHAGPPPDEAIQRFLETAERYGYWNATPQENADVGLHLA
jgi:quercetin dioxygenase-like cupin family protein